MPKDTEVIDKEDVKKDDLPFNETKDDDAIADDKESASDTADDKEQEEAQLLVSRLADDDERTPAEVEADIMQVHALAQTYPMIREMPEYKNLLAIAEKLKEEGGDDAGEDKKEDDKKTSDKKDDSETDDDEKDDKTDDTDDEADAFGITKKGGKEAPKAVDIGKATPELLKFIEKNYAIKDAATFFQSVDGWRNGSQKTSEVEEELRDMTAGLEEMPQPIKDAILAYANAGDYYSAFTKSGERLNYNLDFSDLEKENVVQHYYSEKLGKLKTRLKDGDIDDDAYNERIDELHETAERVYKSDKKIYEKQRADMVRDADLELKAVKSSAISSVEALKKTYPDFSAENLQRIRQRLLSGDIEGLFVAKNGSYKPEAAEMLAHAMFGKSVIDKLLRQAKRDGESDANKKIVERGGKKPRKTSTSTTKSDTKKAEEAIGHLAGNFNNDPYV